MQKDPIQSAEDARNWATLGKTDQAIAALADAVQGIAEYQRYIRHDQQRIMKAMGL